MERQAQKRERERKQRSWNDEIEVNLGLTTRAIRVKSDDEFRKENMKQASEHRRGELDEMKMRKFCASTLFLTLCLLCYAHPYLSSDTCVV